ECGGASTGRRWNDQVIYASPFSHRRPNASSRCSTQLGESDSCGRRPDAASRKYASPLLPLQLLAPRQFGSRWLLRATDRGCLHVGVARIDRVDESARRDSTVGELERARLAGLVEQAFALPQHHGERERTNLVDEGSGKQRV